MSESVLPESVGLQVADKTATLCLNRPGVHNAIDEVVMAGLEMVLDRLDADSEIRCMILTATGSETFCAGGDLRYFATLGSRAAGARMSARMQAILERIWSGPRVAIAAVNGAALGGGCEILTACHFRLAAAHATFCYRQAANGIITGWGGGVRLLRQLGTRGLRLLLTAETLDAEQARTLGLIDQVVAADALMPACHDLAQRISRHPDQAVLAFLEVGRALLSGDVESAKKIEAERFTRLFAGREFRDFLDRFAAR